MIYFTKDILNSIKNNYNNRCNICNDTLYVNANRMQCNNCFVNYREIDSIEPNDLVFYFQITAHPNHLSFYSTIRLENENIYGVSIKKDDNKTNFSIFDLNKKLIAELLLSNDIDFDPILTQKQIIKIYDNICFY